MTKFVLRLILSDLRGAGNVGSILRTADAAGAELIYACGYTPYPRLPNSSQPPDDSRPPHVIASNHRAIAKTALGAEASVPVKHYAKTTEAIHEARAAGFKIIVIEQAENSLNLYRYKPLPNVPLALLLGNETEGVPSDILTLADTVLELPMIGRKESLNVAVSAAIAMYQLRFGM